MNAKTRPAMDRLCAKRTRQLLACAKRSRYETVVAEALDSLRIRYIWQKGYLCKGTAVRIVDFCLPDNRVIIEVDGPEHNAEKDEIRAKQVFLAAKKYRILRITNDQVLNTPNLAQVILGGIWRAKAMPPKTVVSL